MRNVLLFLVLLCGIPALAVTHYVSYSSGSDSNAGTSIGSPWKHAPGMLGLTPAGVSTGDGCSANCASYTPAAGDFIILKGGDTWPYTTMPWHFTQSGSSSTSTYGCAGTGCIYVGNAIGAGLSAWNSGTVTGMWISEDLGGWNPASPPTISCTGGGGTGAAATSYVIPAAETADPEIAGMLYTVTQTSAGSSYTSAPTCTLTGSGIGTLGTSIDQPIIDFGNFQGSPPDWPMGQCSTYPTTCVSGIQISGSYVLFYGLNVQNMRMQQNTLSGLNDVHTQMVEMSAIYDTVANSFVHGLWVDCYYTGLCSTTQDSQWDAIGPTYNYDEVANDIVEDGDAAFLGNSTQSSNNICSTNYMCTQVSFGIATSTQGLYGPVSAHGNLDYANFWQLRFAGYDAGGSNVPFLSYGNDFWLTLYSLNFNSHINARYMQIGAAGFPATLISWNNLVHHEVGGTSSQIQCPSGSAFTFYNEVTWLIGNGTQPYGLDMNDVGGTGGCTLTLYNDTMYANLGTACVGSQAGSNTTTVTMQNNHCINGSTAPNPYWSTATNSVYQNYAGSTTSANIQAASVVQSTTTATSQGYVNNNIFAPTLSSNSTVTFATGGTASNLTSLCSGNLTALCSDINGNARPNSAFQAGAYNFTTGSTSAPTPPQLLLAKISEGKP